MTDIVQEITEEPELYHRAHAILVFDRPALTEWLADYFGINNRHGSYYYTLGRDKEAFHVGTMSMDDFTEFGDEVIDDLVEFLLSKLKTY